MQIDRIEQRIENYTSSLSQAVQEGRGAQFSMLLSLITASEDLALKQAVRGSEKFELPQQALSYPDPDSFYSQEIVGRLNRSVSEERLGDFAYLRSHLESQAETPEREALSMDDFSKMGLASAGRLMLDEINLSEQRFEAVA
ncbi:MAG: hypothetical protein V7731_13035 [Amphritea sp.]